MNLTVAFLHVDGADYRRYRSLAERMVASVRKAMPEAQIAQMTDVGSVEIQGVNLIVRSRVQKGEEFMPYRLRLLAEWNHFPAVFLDTDVVVKGDLSTAFEREFDVGLTRRDYPVLVGGVDIARRMPFNTGVMFARGPEFFAGCCEAVQGYSLHDRQWWGDQVAVAEVARSGKFRVAEFPSELWNRVPRFADDVGDALAVHFKGEKRKDWMLAA